MPDQGIRVLRRGDILGIDRGSATNEVRPSPPTLAIMGLSAELISRTEEVQQGTLLHIPVIWFTKLGTHRVRIPNEM